MNPDLFPSSLSELVPTTLPAMIAVVIGIVCLFIALYWVGERLWLKHKRRSWKAQDRRTSAHWQAMARHHAQRYAEDRHRCDGGK